MEAAFMPSVVTLKRISQSGRRNIDLLQPPPILRSSGTCPSMAHQHTSLSLLKTAAMPAMADFSAEALGFFNGVRIPSALIAGSSLGAVFSLVQLANKHRRELANTDVILVRLYHLFAMASLLLSLNVIIMSTVASTTLLLDHHDTMAYSAYQLLNREMRYEFVITRWSFLVSILCFLVGVTNRALLEFNLLKKPRRRFGVCLILAMTALLTHLVSFINETLYCWGSLNSMTWTVIKLTWDRAVRRRKSLEIISLLSALGTAILAPWLVVESIVHSGNDDGGQVQHQQHDDDDDDHNVVQQQDDESPKQ